MEHKNLIKDIAKAINSLRNIDESSKSVIADALLNSNEKINLLITGSTGCGKSSTINALFGSSVASIGTGTDPETMDIKKYELKNNIVLWDSPGLGDSPEKDKLHAAGIKRKLAELDENKDPIIDLVLVILDGSTRDYGTSYTLINDVIIPSLGDEAQERIIVAINRSDIAMNGINIWDKENNKPTPKLEAFLEQKVESVKSRIKESTGVNIDPIYYSAGYKDEDYKQAPWNLTKLLLFIVENTKLEKRMIYSYNISTDANAWKDSDEKFNYKEEIEILFKKSFIDRVKQALKKAGEGAAVGAAAGTVVPGVGTEIGTIVGAVAGAITGFFDLNWW